MTLFFFVGYEFNRFIFYPDSSNLLYKAILGCQLEPRSGKINLFFKFAKNNLAT